MTLPLSPAPALSEAAQPMPRVTYPEPPPDLEEAARFFENGAQPRRLHERDLRERELLGMAMASPHGLAALRQLTPSDFAIPVNRNVATAIVQLAGQGRPYDAAAVTEELRKRPMTERNSQLVPHLDPTVPNRTIDPRTYGLGAWQTVALAPEGRAPLLAQEIRAQARQDAAVHAAHTALKQFRHALEWDRTGVLQGDDIGEATKALNDRLASLPKPIRASEIVMEDGAWTKSRGSRDLGLPTPPSLSPAGRAAIRQAR